MGDEDLPGVRSGLQAAGQVHFAADDGVVHARIGAEVAHGAVAGVDAHADFQRLGDALGAPLLAQHLHVLAHGDGHGDGGHRVLLRALGGRVAEEHHHRVADELVDGAAEFQGDLRHLVQVGVEQVGQRLGFQLLGQLGEALDVGEEHRQLLALGFQAHALAAAEDRLPHLRRQVLGEVVRQPRGLFLFAGDRLLGLGQAQPLLVDEVGDDADVQPREQDADQRHQHRRLALEAGHGQRPGEHRGAQRDQQDQAERAQAAEHQRGKGQHQNQHQAGHHRIAEQRRAGAGMHGVDVEQQLAGAVGVFGLEAAAQVVGQVRVEQGVRDHP
ncbi:hypothetical protein D3C76_994750 [compost metagenome]